eukprot:6899704-Pyramimonas_sp.AAC.1
MPITKEYYGLAKSTERVLNVTNNSRGCLGFDQLAVCICHHINSISSFTRCVKIKPGYLTQPGGDRVVSFHVAIRILHGEEVRNLHRAHPAH